VNREETNLVYRDLSTRLGLNQDEGEKWIVNLIRDTRVDAKIDYKQGTVIMNHPPQSVYQQVIERTKGAFFRTQVLRFVNTSASTVAFALTRQLILTLIQCGCRKINTH
jgi:translation initiation factor 3 subunit E